MFVHFIQQTIKNTKIQKKLKTLKFLMIFLVTSMQINHLIVIVIAMIVKIRALIHHLDLVIKMLVILIVIIIIIVIIM